MLLPLRQFVQLLSRLTHRRDGRGWRERSHNINFLSNRHHHSSWRITSKKQGRYWNCRSSSRHISLCWPILLPASESRRAASDRLSGIFKFGQILQLVKRWGMNRFVIHGWHSPLRRRWARGRRKRDGSQTQEELEGFGGNASGLVAMPVEWYPLKNLAKASRPSSHLTILLPLRWSPRSIFNMQKGPCVHSLPLQVVNYIRESTETGDKTTTLPTTPMVLVLKQLKRQKEPEETA